MYKMVLGWSIHEKLACPYRMENNKAFITLMNSGKGIFFIATKDSCQVIIDIKTTKKTS